MNSVNFGNKWFAIPGDGIQFDANYLELTLVLDETTIEELQEMVEGNTEVVEIYNADHTVKTGEFDGYTVLDSICKVLDRRITAETTGDCAVIYLKEPSLEQRLTEVEAQTLYTSMMTDTIL